MEYINAPWRAQYVKNVFKAKGCIFCDALKIRNDREALILHRGKHNFVILNKYPYTPGHLMIAPLKHLASPESATQAAAHEMWDMLTRCLSALKRQYHPQGFNTGMNLGQCAGAGIADHYHIHVIPRWPGDSNFMPLIGKVKVTIETLDTTFAHLHPYFKTST